MGEDKSKVTPSKKTKNHENKICARTALTPPEYAHPKAVDFKDREVLCHHDLHSKVYEQAMKEWNAKAAVLWTLGQGVGATAAVRCELLMLAFAHSELHDTFASYAIDSAIAHRQQVDDPSLRKRMAQALADDGSSDAASRTGSKKGKTKEEKKDKDEKKDNKNDKDKGEKKAKKEEEDAEEDDSEEEEEESDSSSGSSS